MNYTVGSYRRIEVETTDPIKLVIMLYEGAINFLEQAKRRMMDKKVAEKGILISKVMAIVGELQASLNMDKGGEVAVNMDRIYTYISNRLYDANMKNDPAILTEVISHLRVLKEAWDKARSAAPAGEPAVAQSAAVVGGYAQAVASRPMYAPMHAAAPAPQPAAPATSMQAIEIIG